jgi:uncharacterized protein (TIGR02421 family)
VPDASYADRVRALSERVVSAQRGIRVLDAIKWGEDVQSTFFASGCRELPKVDAAYYQRTPLAFDPADARSAFRDIQRDIAAQLGRANPAGRIMHRMCDEYLEVIELLAARGTPAFGEISKHLYGSASDAFHAGGPSVSDLAGSLDRSLRAIDESAFLDRTSHDIPAREAVARLQQRLDRTFSEPGARVRVTESDGIVADAAAGSDYIKLRKDVLFSERDLRVLEAHEGWVHVGTTLNGQRQPFCTFLAKGTPSTTITQEGLALLVEILAGVSHPTRLRRITDRVHAIARAEAGANFVEVFEAMVERGRTRDEAYTTTVRVFRGSTPEGGGPFTKDLAYHKGFVSIYSFMQIAVRRGRLDRIPLLFCGKLTLEDVGTLANLLEQQLIVPPLYLPPPVADLNGLSAWLAYSSFLERLDLAQVEADYARLLA